MIGNMIARAFLALALVASAVEAQATTIDWAPVADPGNQPDLRYGAYGAVADPYAIGTYEITAGQYTDFLNAVAKTDDYSLYDTAMWTSVSGCKIQRERASGDYHYSVASDYADRPVNYVSFWDAARFCNWLHNGQGSGGTETGAYSNVGDQAAFEREPDAKFWIPTEDQWYKAAYYKGGGPAAGYWDFPTGTYSAPGRSMDESTNLGNNANYYDGIPPYPIELDLYYTTRAGEFESSDSAYGTFDQGGNVWEWNETVSGSKRVMRGGCFGIGSTTLAASFRNTYDPAAADGGIGFRVATVPEPGIVVLLVGAAAALIEWRRRKHPASF